MSGNPGSARKHLPTTTEWTTPAVEKLCKWLRAAGLNPTVKDGAIRVGGPGDGLVIANAAVYET